jgi:hypothetical protein
MSFGEIFSKNSGTRVVFKTTLVAVFAIIIYAVNHYRTLNRSEDPAVAEARQIMAEFEKMGSDFDLAYKFRLLDSADSIYSSLKGYEDSYERGLTTGAEPFCSQHCTIQPLPLILHQLISARPLNMPTVR